MNENPTPPVTTEKTVIVTHNHLRGLWTLTIASIALNGLILLLILICFIAHHRHHKRHGHGGEQNRGGAQMEGFRGGFHHHHHFGRFGGEGRGGPGGGDRGRGFGGDRHEGMGMDRPGFRGEGRDGGPGREGGKEGGRSFGEHRGGDGRGGMGMGMMGGRDRTPPDPAKMTDGIVDHLTKQLTLTDDEKGKIKPIIEAQVAQMQKDMEAQRQAREKAFTDLKAKLKPILDADQQKQLDALPGPGQKPADKAPEKPTDADKANT